MTRVYTVKDKLVMLKLYRAHLNKGSVPTDEYLLVSAYKKMTGDFSK